MITKNKDINEMIIREILFSGKYILDTLDNNNFSVLSFDLKDNLKFHLTALKAEGKYNLYYHFL